jgi:hypothetical protein
LFLALAGIGQPHARAQGPNQAGLVVRFGDGTVITRCVTFGEGDITGYDVLTRSGLNVVFGQGAGLGVSVCQIEGQGCPGANCFCKCTGSTCAYWTYWHLVDGEWSYSGAGADAHVVRPGDVEGWSWGDAVQPPVIPLAQVCAPTPAPSPTPTDTPRPTDTPTTSPTHTPRPTHTATPVPTHTPVPVRTHTRTLPTDSPSPTNTPTRQPTQAATHTHTPSPAPTSTPEPTPSPPSEQPTSTAGPDSTTEIGQTPNTNYIVFGAIVVGLLVLAFVIMRRR